MRIASRPLAVLLLVCPLAAARSASGQSYGVELNNTLMPASGGMAGTSIANPQDMLSGLNGNPGTLTQFAGTQVVFSGAWADPNIHVNQTGALPLPGVSPFSATSATPGVGAGNIGISQNFSERGLPITTSLGLISGAGGGTDFRPIPQSNGTSSNLLILQFTGGLAVDITQRLSVGSTISLGEGFFAGPYVGTSTMVPAYGLRGTIGANYHATDSTSVGLYYQSGENFNFRDAVRLNLGGGRTDSFHDVQLALPQNVGFGVANTSLADGKLLLAMDVLYKEWSEANLFKNIYHDQWVLQFGTQYTMDRYKFRLGYAWAENPIKAFPDINVGGVTLVGGLPAANYLQSQLAVINQHRLSAGIGVSDVVPGVDADFFAGGMFRASQQLGPLTNVAVSSYWAGGGLTWRFGGKCGVCRATTPLSARFLGPATSGLQ
jgi:long-chain fatty acid transport protein